VYSTYTQGDYQELFTTYMYIDPMQWWVSRDYGKYNVSSANPQRMDTSPTASQLWLKEVRRSPVWIPCPQTIAALCSVRILMEIDY
jgi:hypothetical protein